jgi:hypothetical protein
MLRKILHEYREKLEFNRDKGDYFERLTLAFFLKNSLPNTLEPKSKFPEGIDILALAGVS